MHTIHTVDTIHTLPAVNLPETWNGTSWSETHEINTARYGIGLSGTTTATLGAGGHTATGVVVNVESYNGSA